MLYDQDGNLIAEANAATGEILREYFWLGGRAVVAWIDGYDITRPHSALANQTP